MAVGHERRARQALREAVRRANRQIVEERAISGGAGEGAAIFHLWWQTVPAEAPAGGGGRFQAVAIAYLAFLLGLVSYQVVPIAVVSDRLEGISESFGATPTPLAALLISRVLAVTLLELLALLLLGLSSWALLASLIPVPVPSLENLVRAATALAFINTLYLLPGVRARSAREALNLSSVALLASVLEAFLASVLEAFGVGDWVVLAS